jgi:hypothetical protein
MSVAVLISYVDHAGPHSSPAYLPVATESVYRSHWLPAAEQLGCMWLPRFQTGAPVALDDLPAVLEELERVRDHFAQLAPGDAVLEHVRERSRWLVSELARLDAGVILELYIG